MESSKKTSENAAKEIDACLEVAIKIRDDKLSSDKEKLDAITLIERLAKTKRAMERDAARTPASGAPARVPEDEAETSEERIQVIIDMMAALRWHPREAKRLAKLWGVSVSRVRDYAGEASRAVRRSIGDKEEIRSQFYSALVAIASRAENQRSPDHHAATKALTAAADMIGLQARPEDTGASKIEVTISRYKEPEPQADDGDPEA